LTTPPAATADATNTRPRHAGMAVDPFWYNVLESARANVFEWCAATRPGIAILSQTALKPVDLQGRPVEVREPPRAVLEERVHLRKERVRLGGADPVAGAPKGLRTASAAPSPPWIAARCAH
jgi:hypothetical protein